MLDGSAPQESDIGIQETIRGKCAEFGDGRENDDELETDDDSEGIAL